MNSARKTTCESVDPQRGSKWPRVKLGNLLLQQKREVGVNPTTIYNLLGAHWYSKGLYIKETKPGSQIKASSLYRIKKGDFVYNRLFAWKGAFAIASKKEDGCYVSNEFPCFEINGDRLDAKYLLLYFSRQSAWNEALGLSYGATPTSRNRLREEKFLGLELPLPPIGEQRRIVARIDQLAAKIAKAHTLRRQAVAEAETLFEQGRAQVFEAASKQASALLGNLAILERGKFSYRPRNDPRFFGGSHPWIQIAEIERSNKFICEWTETLNDEGLAISKKFPKGTVLVSIAATIGAVGILDFDCCVPDSIVGVTPREGTDSEFLYHFFGYVRTHLESIAPQSAQKNINLQILSPLPVPKLELRDQHRTVAYLDSLQANVGALQRLQADNATELDALLPSILAKAFQGEL